MPISWDLLAELEKNFGDSFYLLDLGLFRQNYRDFLRAFQRLYARTNVAYSYKTNYAPRLCQAVNDMGGYAEVVSGMEYGLATRIGVSPERIIFNGPYKSSCDIELALLAGSVVNLDSLYEIDVVEAVAKRSQTKTLTVGLRCNFDVGSPEISRFGFDVDGTAFRLALSRLRALENVCVGGLHCHYSTSARSVESYARRASRMLALCTVCFGERRPTFVNLGGGFFSQMSPALQKQFDVPVPSFEDYANAIATQVAGVFRDGAGPELILEPGAAITANILQFVAKIVDIKQVGSRRVALSTGSIHNIKPTLHKKNLPARVYSRESRPDGAHDEVDIAGYTCMESDILHRRYDGPLAVGDYAVFDNVGAYTIVMKPPFIRPAPAIVAWAANGASVELIRRREEMDDVFATYCF